jgi:RNA polymerase sigma-70 factor (sigma-E family)
MSEAFEDYVRARSPSLLRLGYLLVGDLHEAEDVLQTVLARLGMRWAHVSRLDNVDAYVRTALTNASASWWRQRRRRLDIPTETLPDPEDAGPDAEQRAEVMAMLRQLPPRQRSVIVLRYYEGLSEIETAQILGCSLGTVKSQSVKARRSLRAAWLSQHPVVDHHQGGNRD